MSDLQLTGMTSLGMQGCVFISKGAKKNYALLTKVDTAGRFQWQSQVAFMRTKGKRPSKLWILNDYKFIYWVHLVRGKIRVAILDSKTGSVESKEHDVYEWTETAYDPIPSIHSGRLILLIPKENGTGIVHLNPYNSDEKEVSYLAVADPIIGGSPKIAVAFAIPYGFVAYSYLVNKTHTELNLRLFFFNYSGTLLNEKIHVYKLKDNSFARNAQYDDRLFYIEPAARGFYIFGKLDFKAKEYYSPNTASDGFVGFWCSHFSETLTEYYFVEHPFKTHSDFIPNGIINKSVLVDFKEDENENLFIQFAGIKDFTTHQTYLFKLNSNGTFNDLNKMMSDYNFFEYNGWGLRNTNRKSKLRLMNDAWRYYSTNFLDEVADNQKFLSSSAIRFIGLLSTQNPLGNDGKAYNFQIYSKEKAVVYEYLDKKKGTLRVYQLPLNFSK